MNGLDPRQFREYVVRPALRHLDPEIPYSVAAENLVVGTAMQESQLRYLDQLAPGPGPAYGIFQIEARTYHDHVKWIDAREDLKRKVDALRAPSPSGLEQLRTNLLYGAALCRVHYRRSRLGIPDADDVVALGRVWKAAYNTVYGKGTVEQFVRSYGAAR